MPWSSRVRAEVERGSVNFTLTYRVRAADGRWVWLQHLGHVAREESGAAHTLHAVLFDITDGRRREHAAKLLAAAAQALAAPGEVEDRLRAVAALLAAQFGHWAAVWLAGDDGRYRPVAAAPTAMVDRVFALTPLSPPRPSAQQAPGRSFVVTEPPKPTRDAGVDRRGAVAAFPGERWLVTPLVTGGEQAGLLTVGIDSRGGDDADLALVDDLGPRIAAMLAAERLAGQQRYLHRLTVALAGAETAGDAGTALTTSLIEALDASVVAVCTLGEDGRLHTIDVHGYSPGWVAEFGTIELSAPVPVAEAARTRRPVWLPDRAALVSRYPQVAPFLQPRTEASASLPLVVGDRLVGAVGVVFARPHGFAAAERTFLLTVAQQVAAALERAALADVRREMAETLQRSLLPARLPTIDRITVAARYLPAVEGTLAGGDWFDAVVVGDECLALTIGDVVGHGAGAAAVMGRLSSALTALLSAGYRPGPALELLERLAAGVDGARLATVACLLLDPATDRLTYSTAGHLPPLMLSPDGSVTSLDAGHGPALAVTALDHRRPEASTGLPAGATLLLYTDGLVERRDDASLNDGLHRLAAAAARHRGAPVSELVDALLADLVDGSGSDDIAVLAARRTLP